MNTTSNFADALTFQSWMGYRERFASRPQFIETAPFETDGSVVFAEGHAGLLDWFRRGCIVVTDYAPFEHETFTHVIWWRLSKSTIEDVVRESGREPRTTSGYALVTIEQR